MKAKSKFTPVFVAARQAEADKTSRLRALRLAKEAADKADKEAAAREAAATAETKRRRVRSRPVPVPLETA